MERSVCMYLLNILRSVFSFWKIKFLSSQPIAAYSKIGGGGRNLSVQLLMLPWRVDGWMTALYKQQSPRLFIIYIFLFSYVPLSNENKIIDGPEFLFGFKISGKGKTLLHSYSKCQTDLWIYLARNKNVEFCLLDALLFCNFWMLINKKLFPPQAVTLTLRNINYSPY
mgnify:CR=1 FL=1